MARLLVFLRSTTGLLTAVAALLGAIVTLVGIFGLNKPPGPRPAVVASDAPPPASGMVSGGPPGEAASAGPSGQATSTDAVFSQGSMTVMGSWIIDLDLGVDAPDNAPADFWWAAGDVQRKFVPEGATFSLVGQQDFAALGLDRIKQLKFSGDPIPADYDPSNQTTNDIPDGTVLAYKTKQGRYGKLLIVKYARDLQIRWLTYAGS